MDERVMQLRIGLMVVAITVIIGILLMMIGGEQTLTQRFQRKHVFYVEFPEAPGVTRDTPVQKSGIRIGRVTEVRLAEEVTERELDDDVGVVVTIEIDRNRRIFRDEVCYIKRNLLGDAVLEFVKVTVDENPDEREASDQADLQNQGNPQSSDHAAAQDESLYRQSNPGPRAGKAREPGAWLRGKVRADPIQVVGNLEEDLSAAIRSIGQTSDEIRDFVAKINEFMGTREELGPKQERFSDILDGALLTMEKLEQLADNANDLIGDEHLKRDLKDAVAQFPEVMHELRDTLGQVSHTVGAMEEMMRSVNNNLRNVEAFTERLGTEGGMMVQRLDRAAGSLDALFDDLLTLTDALKSEKSSLGRLIRDPEMYDKLDRAVTSIEDLTRRLRPVAENARIFSDKIARHPELLGVRGAFEPSSGTKGVPRLSQLRGIAGQAPRTDDQRSSPPHGQLRFARPAGYSRTVQP